MSRMVAGSYKSYAGHFELPDLPFLGAPLLPPYLPALPSYPYILCALLGAAGARRFNRDELVCFDGALIADLLLVSQCKPSVP